MRDARTSRWVTAVLYSVPNTTAFEPSRPYRLRVREIGNESVPIPLAQCWFPGLAISNAKI